MRHTLIFALVACVASGVATAQEERDVPEQEVVIAGSRLPASLDTFPGSVTVVDEATIATQRELSSDLGDLLAITVPSLGTSSFMGS
ncbi:MAG: TonB-dependent receptor, partial [Steroidobacteraceae bacterium]